MMYTQILKYIFNLHNYSFLSHGIYFIQIRTRFTEHYFCSYLTKSKHDFEYCSVLKRYLLVSKTNNLTIVNLQNTYKVSLHNIVSVICRLETFTFCLEI